MIARFPKLSAFLIFVPWVILIFYVAHEFLPAGIPTKMAAIIAGLPSLLFMIWMSRTGQAHFRMFTWILPFFFMYSVFMFRNFQTFAAQGRTAEFYACQRLEDDGKFAILLCHYEPGVDEISQRIAVYPSHFDRRLKVIGGKFEDRFLPLIAEMKPEQGGKFSSEPKKVKIGEREISVRFADGSERKLVIPRP